MNHRKKAPDLNLPVLLVLLMAGIIVATGGISYVVVVNKQVTIRREIERSESRMHDHRVAITEHQADIDETLGVFRLRERLATSGSALEPIPAGVIERLYRPEPVVPEDQVAAR